jgi:hypothetical protein
LYSASVEESAIVGWSLLVQAIGALPNLYKMPKVERQESASQAQSASVKVCKQPLLFYGKKKQKSLVPLR